ncbi:MAG: SMI1/KNR4 family protein [Cytophagales bacterium]|nr:SMI1/KNR4 family protein [Cytophagales bacterium]
MEFSSVIYQGDSISDKQTFNSLPKELQNFLEQVNGIIAFGGGLQIYGCVKQPDWFSLRTAWNELLRTYEQLTSNDIPFAQDCMGDHFVLRNSQVFYMNCETGEIDNLELNFNEFLREAISNPVEFLSLNPLLQYRKDGGTLEPGELLNAYPPFSMKAEPERMYSIKNVPALEQRSYLADFYKQTKNLKDGQQIKVKVINQNTS